MCYILNLKDEIICHIAWLQPFHPYLSFRIKFRRQLVPYDFNDSAFALLISWSQWHKTITVQDHQVA